MMIEIMTDDYDGSPRVSYIEDTDWLLLKEYQDIIDKIDIVNNAAEYLKDKHDRCAEIYRALQKKGLSKHDFRVKWRSPQYDRHIKIENILK